MVKWRRILRPARRLHGQAEVERRAFAATGVGRQLRAEQLGGARRDRQAEAAARPARDVAALGLLGRSDPHVVRQPRPLVGHRQYPHRQRAAAVAVTFADTNAVTFAVRVTVADAVTNAITIAIAV